MKLGHGNVSEPFPMRQYCCSVHGRFREYPSFLVPLKHYPACIILGALEARAAGGTVEDVCSDWGIVEASTLVRWRREAARPASALAVQVRDRGEGAVAPRASDVAGASGCDHVALGPGAVAQHRQGLGGAPRLDGGPSSGPRPP